MSVDYHLGEHRVQPELRRYEDFQSGNVFLSADEERDFFNNLAKQTECTHLKALAMANRLVSSLVTTGKALDEPPILKAAPRPKYQKELYLDLSDPFTASFLEGMGCSDEEGLKESTAAYLGNCAVVLEDITRADQLTSSEYNRLDAVPIPGKRVIFEPLDI